MWEHGVLGNGPNEDTTAATGWSTNVIATESSTLSRVIDYMVKNCIKTTLEDDFQQILVLEVNPIEVNQTKETGENPVF